MHIFKSINKRQSGAALVIVLIMMAMAGLMVAPLMNWMTSGLKNVQRYDNKNSLLYAADGGIQKGVWQISTYTSAPEVSFSNTLPTFTLNGKNVEVTINYVWILEGIVDPSFGPHNTWIGMTTTGTASSNGTYTINLDYSNDYSGNKKIDQMGVWLPQGFGYVSGSASNKTLFPNNIDLREPSSITHIHGGTSIMWDNVNYSFKQTGEFATEQFLFTSSPGSLPTGDVAWVSSLSSDIGLSWDNMIWNYSVTSTATDPATGQSINILAYVNRNDKSSNDLAISTYQIQ